MEASTSLPRGINRKTPIEVNDSLVTRFWAAVDRRGDDECWPWTKSLRNKNNPHGSYGAIKQGEKLLNSHCVSFAIHHGEVPKGKIVLHSCDNRLCCNPKHLSAGTPGKNIKEMHERGRANMPIGERAWNVRITSEQARLILAVQIVTGLGERRIAKRVGIPYSTVKGVIARKNWRHIDIPSLEEAQQIVNGVSPITEETPCH